MMDLETYETFDILVDEEFLGQLQPGQEINYMIALGRKKITRV